MTSKLPSVAAVALNWNNRKDIAKLIESLLLVQYQNLDIIVVDNASTDDSVEFIKENYPSITLLCNKENLGGTGGFNSGIKGALSLGTYDYIWLLDNDVIVSPNALLPLVNAMGNDPIVGLAGSKIINSEDPDKVVETGAMLLWSRGEVHALNRNRKDSRKNKIHEVDYVAVCSALVRVSALVDFGLMDDRYFLLWDDMDWGATCKSHGYKVIAVDESVVYHAAFTEKRSQTAEHYYSLRNPLLAISKHAKGIDRILGFYNTLRRISKAALILSLNNNNSDANLCHKALWHFLSNQWGKIPQQKMDLKPEIGLEEFPYDFSGKNILVLPTGSSAEISKLREGLQLAKEKGAKISLLISHDRRDLIQEKHFEEIVEYGFDRDLLDPINLRVFLKIIKRKYDVGVHPCTQRVSPFSFVIKKILAFDQKRSAFVRSNDGRSDVWKVMVTLIFGELKALALLPVVLLRAHFYYREGMNRTILIV